MCIGSRCIQICSAALTLKGVGGVRKSIQGSSGRDSVALFKSGQWHFHQDNTSVHNSIVVTDYLTKMGIKTAPYSPDLAPCDFGLFPKLKVNLEAVVMRQLR